MSSCDRSRVQCKIEEYREKVCRIYCLLRDCFVLGEVAESYILI